MLRRTTPRAITLGSFDGGALAAAVVARLSSASGRPMARRDPAVLAEWPPFAGLPAGLNRARRYGT